jgi:hypothetical protein
MCAHPPQGDHPPMPENRTSTIALRPVASHEDRVLRRLSELDSARTLERPAVLAVVDGEPVAAISLSDGQIVADPFTRTEDVVELLRHRVTAIRKAA